MRLECCHADTCLPDYWTGHHLPHVQILVHRGMTLKEVKDAIKDELRHGYVMGSTEAAELLSRDFVPAWKEKEADRLTRAAYAAVNRLKPAKQGQRKLFLDLPEETTCEPDSLVFAYFVFREM